LYGEPFEAALSSFRLAFEKERLAHLQRERCVRNGIADLLGDIVFDDILGDVRGRRRVRLTFGLAHDATPDFFRAAGVEVDITLTMPIPDIPEATLQRKSCRNEPITDLDFARAMVDSHLRDLSLKELLEDLDGRKPTIEEFLAAHSVTVQQVGLAQASEIWESGVLPTG
jgi:hypothetical protein